MKRIALILLLPLVCAGTAVANDYFPDDAANWYRYVGSNGQQVESRVALEEDGWTFWTELAGLGPRWVFTDSSDVLWVYDEDTGYGEVLGDLAGGSATVTTPAGTFTDVTRVRLTAPLSGGATDTVWFARGVGVVRWTEGSRTYELTAGFVGGQMLSGASTTSSSSSAVDVAPGEWEEVDSILWGCNDTYLVIDTYVDAFRGLDGHSPRVVSDVSVDSDGTASQLRYELSAANVPMGDVEIFVVALDSIWMRDYGPIVFRDASGQLVVGDPIYYPGRPNDDTFPDAYAAYRGWPRVSSNVEFEGGNFVSDGRGQGFVSNGVLWFNNLSQSRVERELRKLGVDEVEFFEPLIDEGTTHIDMFNKLVSPTHAVVSSYPSGHRQKPVVDAAARRMRDMGYSVERIGVHTGHDEYATYANSLLANGIALVPQYGSASRDRAARDTYERLGFQAIGVDCRLLIEYGGAVHCISMQIPAR